MIRRKMDGCPPCVLAKAYRLLALFRAGKGLPIRHIRRNGYLSMSVNPFWRLLSKNGGKNWFLLIHAEYDKEIQK